MMLQQVTLIGPIMFVFGLVMLSQSLPPEMEQSSEFMLLQDLSVYID